MIDKHLYWYVTIQNSVSIICFMILAIVFKDWRIALCSLFFITHIKYDTNRYYKICDSCGKHSPYADSRVEATKKAEKLGWICKKNGDTEEDYCPECQKKFKK